MKEQKGSKSAAVREFLGKHPDPDNATHKEFIHETKKKVSDAVFYKVRQKFKETPGTNGKGLMPTNFLIHGKLRDTYEKIAKYLKKNVDVGYEKMLKDTNVKIAYSTFRRFRNRCIEYWKSLPVTERPSKPQARPQQRKRGRLGMYKPIFTADSSNLTEKAKTLLKNFVEALNESKVGLYEVKEYHDPRELEVREVE